MDLGLHLFGHQIQKDDAHGADVLASGCRAIDEVDRFCAQSGARWQCVWNLDGHVLGDLIHSFEDKSSEVFGREVFLVLFAAEAFVATAEPDTGEHTCEVTFP
ncbi:hypothetical protein [Rubritalea tangerina]|uniref:hypothetical protein n=1 Tax=Rubritalea tangerina TaxID=430798 RepID=UPI00361B3880